MTWRWGLAGLLVVAILAAGAGWAFWLVTYEVPGEVRAGTLAVVLVSAFVVFMLGDRRKGAVWPRFAFYGAAIMVSAAMVWLELVWPLGAAGSLGAIAGRIAGLDGFGVFLTAAPPVGLVVMSVLWIESVFEGFKRLDSAWRRRRAQSDLYGKARLLDRRYLRRLSRRRGVLLGQRGRGRWAPLIAWPLEGSAVTFAPPRVGKGALIALNLLSPGHRGFAGSTVVVDPRGEMWCVAARRRREMGRRVRLLDPFGVVENHAVECPSAHLPDRISATYNPLDFIRADESLAVRDINVLLDALLTPPPTGAHQNTRHFYESARAIIAGYVAWVRFKEPVAERTLGRVYSLLSAAPIDREAFMDQVLLEEPFAGGLTHLAVQRQAQVGKEEGGSNFTTIANQLAFLNFPEMVTQTRASSFDPLELVDGNTDLFVVAPEEMVEHVKGWIRMWITIPNAIASIKALKRDLLIVIDEMPRLGTLKPVMDGYSMAAGKGVHFWCFAQSISALDATWGKENRKTLTHLAEIVQILGFPRSDAEGAEELSRAIGTATFESRSENRSGSVPEDQVLAGNARLQAGETFALARERLVTPDDLMTLAPDRQFVIAAPKDMPRDALHLHHARYWVRWSDWRLADPNPFVIRKERALAADKWAEPVRP